MTIDDQKALLDRPVGVDDEESMTNSKHIRVGKLALASLLLACFLANADESFILTTGSDVAAALEAPDYTSWLITSYNLGYTTALPLHGQACDLAGPKKAILIALVLYGFGCILTGISGSIHLALAGRVISGIGGSGMVELVSVLVNEMGSFHQVAVLRSYVTTSSIIGITCGAPLGALLTTSLGWQWAFLIHAPFAILCIAVISLSLKIKKPQSNVSTGQTYGSIDTSKDAGATLKTKSFDVAGLALLMTAIVCLLGLIQVVPAQDMENKSTALITLGVAFLALFGAFFINEVYVATNPLIHMYLLKPHKLGLIYAAQVLIGVTNSASIPIVSDYWVSTRGLSVVEGSICWAPSTVGFAVGSLLTARMIRSSGRYILYTKFGIILACSSFFLMLIRWVLHEPKMWEIAYSFFSSVGLGMILSSQFTALSAAKPDENAATSVTTFYLCQQIGFMAGVTSSRSLVRSAIENGLKATLGENTASQELIDQVLSHRRSLKYVPAHLQNAVRTIIQQSYYVPPVVSIGSLLLVLVISFRQREFQST